MEVGFRDRQLIETEARPELLDTFVKMMDVTFAGSMGPAFGLEIFGVASLGAGSRSSASTSSGSATCGASRRPIVSARRSAPR